MSALTVTSSESRTTEPTLFDLASYTDGIRRKEGPPTCEPPCLCCEKTQQVLESVLEHLRSCSEGALGIKFLERDIEELLREYR
jgi:hypothetical protein